MTDEDLVPPSLILSCDQCGRQYVRAASNEEPCPWCEGDDGEGIHALD